MLPPAPVRPPPLPLLPPPPLRPELERLLPARGPLSPQRQPVGGADDGPPLESLLGDGDDEEAEAAEAGAVAVTVRRGAKSAESGDGGGGGNEDEEDGEEGRGRLHTGSVPLRPSGEAAFPTASTTGPTAGGGTASINREGGEAEGEGGAADEDDIGEEEDGEEIEEGEDEDEDLPEGELAQMAGRILDAGSRTPAG